MLCERRTTCWAEAATARQAPSVGNCSALSIPRQLAWSSRSCSGAASLSRSTLLLFFGTDSERPRAWLIGGFGMLVGLPADFSALGFREIAPKLGARLRGAIN